MSKRFVNIHCHRSEESDTLVVQNVYINTESSLIPKKTDSAYKSIGIHPWFVTKESFEKQLNILTEQLASEDVFAIGECGLDRLKGPDFLFQEEILKAQCQLAVQLNKPVILHVVKSIQDILQFQKKHRFTCPMIIHGFRGNATEAQNLVNAGFYLSFGHALLNGIPKLEEAFGKSPVDRIFLETDTAEIPVRQVYEKAAFLKGIPLEKLILQIKQNLERIR